MLMKSFARGACSVLLKITLFSAAITAALVAVIGTPGTIKKSIDDSKLYSSVIDTAFSETQDKLETEGQQAVSIAAPELKQAAETSFTPDVLKSSSEQVIDSVYVWLNSDTKLPDFHVDLSAQKAQFIAAAGTAAEQHFNTLPVCSRDQLKSLNAEDDVFSLPCRPPSLTAVAARDQVVADLNKSDFLKDPVLSADTLTNKVTGQNPFQEARAVQDKFKLLKLMPEILLGISALLGIGVFVLSITRRKGLKSLGITFLTTGIFVLISGWFASFILGRLLTAPNGAAYQLATTELEKALIAAAKSLNSHVGRTLLIYSAAYSIVGAGTLLALHLTKPKELERAPEEAKADIPLVVKPPETKEKSAV